MDNPKITITDTELLSKNWATLTKVTFDYETPQGTTQIHKREVYDRGNGAVIFLYNKASKNTILIKQFRLPTYLNENPDGFLIEACAGLLEKENPEDCIKRETEEETGYEISAVKKIFEAYMSPGSVTEIIHFFTGEYSSEMKISEGGGVDTEQENIEVLEIPFDKAYGMIATGEIIDAKTIMLLQYAKINNLLDN